jgi:hypothetical protein
MGRNCEHGLAIATTCDWCAATEKSNQEWVLCKHGLTFDEAEAQGLSASEVKRRWPRGWFTTDKPCSDCGFTGIAYASAAHYILGDW